ncbi:MAG: SRPBCC family protein [Nocardiopsaceae bacterium]|jgi:uncharacterized protein YndB with AHSA1/START domain|nr:SRPBCC family protein [Nocardiopsaceae bacterium]
MSQSTITPVRHSVTVQISALRAFTLFTEGFNTWWIGHHIGEAEMAEAVIEPRVDGRWYERGVDGTECDWGKVLVYEPPNRLAMTWQLDCDFKYDPDLSHASEVDVQFTESGGQTTVTLEHKYIERHGAGAEGVYEGVSGSGGWPGILDLYAKKAAEAA